MSDIGVVEYSKNAEKNCITAKWFSSIDGMPRSGTGKAVGEMKDNYEGDFVVTYFVPDRPDPVSYDLIIRKTGDCYDLKWFKNGEQKYFGIGFEYDGKLFAGYRIFPKELI